MKQNKHTGFIGEQYAASYLQNHGYQILELNATSRWGELDIIAQKENTVIFVEVKTRKSNRQGKPYEAVQNFKLRHLLRTIQYYIHVNRLQNRKFRMDVISIVLNLDDTVHELKHYENLDTQF